MRFAVSRGLWLVLLLVPALAGFVPAHQDGKSDDPITKLVEQLGDPAFPKRVDASKKLIELGDKALPALRKAAVSGDPELRSRAEEVILKITPPMRRSKTVAMELKRIEPGTFAMGSPTLEKNRRPDEQQHDVRIKSPFYLGTYEVTQAEYRKVMNANPSWFNADGGGAVKVGAQDTGRFPVENVNWFSAIEFCNKLSQLDDLPPYYKIEDITRETGQIRNATVTILGGSGYRLPTEAEWEYACRGHVDAPYNFAKNPTGREFNSKATVITGGYGGGPLWRSTDMTTPAGTYAANGFGLHDMHGNVAEWCWDYYDKDYYANSPRVDPQGPAKGDHRVNRGGSWLTTEVSCRSASRYMQLPREIAYTVGFRVARNP